MTAPTFQHLSVAQLAADMDTKGDVVVVDIRDPNSYAAGRIPGALRLHDGNAGRFVEGADKSAQTVVCCYHGHASQGVAAWLAEQGFLDVYSLDGGATQWAAVGPTEGD